LSWRIDFNAETQRRRGCQRAFALLRGAPRLFRRFG